MWFIDSENLFHFYFEIKKTRFSHLTLIIFVTLKEAPPSNESGSSYLQNVIKSN